MIETGLLLLTTRTRNGSSPYTNPHRLALPPHLFSYKDLTSQLLEVLGMALSILHFVKLLRDSW